MPVSVKPAVQKVCASEERRHAQARDAAGGNCETNESRFVAPDKPAHMQRNSNFEIARTFGRKAALIPAYILFVTNRCPAFRPMRKKCRGLHVGERAAISRAASLPAPLEARAHRL
jgi:hypothetical protein